MASSRKKLPLSAWQRWIKWVAGTGLLSAILLGIAGGPLGDIGNFLRDRIRDFFSPPSQEIKIDFNATRACAQGKLTDLRKLFVDPNTPLTSGADMLTICDTESLQTVRTNLPYELSRRFPGCLVWRGKESGGLAMVRKSDAICSVPGSTDFICDGAKARHFTGMSTVVDSADAVKPCSSDTLRQFGFQF